MTPVTATKLPDEPVWIANERANYSFCDFPNRERLDYIDALRQVASTALEEVKGLRELAYIGDHHFPDLTWKHRCLEAHADLRKAESRVEELRKLLRKVRDGSADLRVCCGNPIEGGGGSFDHPPDPPQCCGEPEMLHDLIDDALAAPPGSQPT